MKSIEENGHALPVLPVRPDPAANGTEPFDTLAEAEGLRALLVEAAGRVVRLVEALQRFPRPRRVRESASPLKSLAQGGGEL